MTDMGLLCTWISIANAFGRNYAPSYFKTIDFFGEIAYNEYAMETLHWKRANLLAGRNPRARFLIFCLFPKTLDFFSDFT